MNVIDHDPDEEDEHNRSESIVKGNIASLSDLARKKPESEQLKELAKNY